MKSNLFKIGKLAFRNSLKYALKNRSLSKDKLLVRMPLHEFLRLKSISRNTSATSLLAGKQVKFPDAFWYLHSFDEIFWDSVYKFKSDTPNPKIIDCGANIGLSIIYFKLLYPDAQVIGFEPDKKIFDDYLIDNIGIFNFHNVQLINKAVWHSPTTLSFLSEGTLGGKITSDVNGPKVITIDTIRLQDYLHQMVDFLKIDIEGAEYEVLKDCRELLINVKNLFIEYHVLPDERQTLHEILTWISAAGFKYYIREAWNNMQYPFMQEHLHYYQMQLNIFCYR